MINRHPDLDLLSEFANGSLDYGLSLLISTHLDQCADCAARYQHLQFTGSELLASTEIAPIDDALFQRLLSRIETTPISTTPQPSTDKIKVPATITIGGDSVPNFPALRGLAEKCAGRSWFKISDTMHVLSVRPDFNAYEIFFLKLSAGGNIPRHSHMEDEFTLVLTGGFSDQEGQYLPGDFVAKTAADLHRPSADQDGSCICLVALKAPIVFEDTMTKLWLKLFSRKKNRGVYGGLRLFG